MTKNEKFSKFLDENCIHRGLLADKIKTTYQTINAHCRGTQSISHKSAIKYANFFNIDINKFIEEYCD